jgi:hypothetical protein
MSLQVYQSAKRTAEKSRRSEAIIQPSASRTTSPTAFHPSDESLGYYHSSASRTAKPGFCTAQTVCHSHSWASIIRSLNSRKSLPN